MQSFLDAVPRRAAQYTKRRHLKELSRGPSTLSSNFWAEGRARGRRSKESWRSTPRRRRPRGRRDGVRLLNRRQPLVDQLGQQLARPPPMTSQHGHHPRLLKAARAHGSPRASTSKHANGRARPVGEGLRRAGEKTAPAGEGQVRPDQPLTDETTTSSPRRCGERVNAAGAPAAAVGVARHRSGRSWVATTAIESS